jgi:beta-1,2-mannosidase
MKKISCLFFALVLIGFTSKQSLNQINKNPCLADVVFEKPEQNPILSRDSTFAFECPVKKEIVYWQKADVFNPAAIVKDGKVYMLYRAEDNPVAAYMNRTSRIGLAYSNDGINFVKHPTPVLYPDNDDFLNLEYPGGCEDPRLVETEDGTYVLTYTSWNNKIARLCVAFSKDLLTWKKKGPAFAKAYDGKFMDKWSKSGSLVTKFVDGKQVVAQIDGKYWMYWGEHFINLAWSDNLIDWHPLLDEDGKIKKTLAPRLNKFDSNFAECGPPAVITDEGIVLLYNGRNIGGEKRDPAFPEGTYSVGKVVFDINDMEKVVYQSDSYLLKPTLPHEIDGQYDAGTTFAEGLVSSIQNGFCIMALQTHLWVWPFLNKV